MKELIFLKSNKKYSISTFEEKVGAEQVKQHSIVCVDQEGSMCENDSLLPIDNIFGKYEDVREKLLEIASKNNMVPEFTTEEFVKQGQILSVQTYKEIPKDEYFDLVTKYLDLEKERDSTKVQFGLELKKLKGIFQGKLANIEEQIEEIRPNVYSSMQAVSETGSWERWPEEELMILLTEDNRLVRTRKMLPHEITQGNIFDKQEDKKVDKEQEPQEELEEVVDNSEEIEIDVEDSDNLEELAEQEPEQI